MALLSRVTSSTRESPLAHSPNQCQTTASGPGAGAWPDRETGMRASASTATRAPAKTRSTVPSPFDIGELLGNPPVPHPKDVHAPDMTALAFLDPRIHPTHHATIAGRKHLHDVAPGVR